MGRMKELWIATHERLADAYMEAHPGSTDTEALDATLAGLMTYLRRAWGGSADPISAAQVTALRAASSARKLPWTVVELEQVSIDRGYGKFVGEYKVSFITLTVFEAAGELHLQVPMYGGGAMQQISDTVFSGSPGGESVKIEFLVEEDDSVNSLLLHRDGQKIPALRVAE